MIGSNITDPDRSPKVSVKHPIRFAAFLITVCLLWVLGISSAHAKSWEQAILDVENMSEEFWQKSRELGFNEALGTAYNEVDVNMHLCAILGRMVGHKEGIRHLEPPQPADGASGREFAIASVSLSNWAIAAKYHSKITAAEKKRIWNLDCVGNYDIPADLYVNVERGFSVRYDDERKSIYIQGDIVEGFSETVKEAINAYPDAKVVGLGSGGGAVYEAMRAGRYIRAAGLETELLNDCYSACPLALFGGTVRFMWYPHSAVGFHQVSVRGIALPLDDPTYRDIANYVALMGGDVSLVLGFMFSANPREMYLADELERCASRVVTNHQRGCIN
ncbi:hypothetical protein [uncultured Aliiroseovarius sp.]|uniref:hypothetical protein n=1 Tax=uncultured Aliiroseovarius sp. TaxID=1658783 RepID=UPI00261A08C2|nr:hypothetical protein [uncultured Aliiroseovarius sp.]